MSIRKILAQIWLLPRKIGVSLISIYQKTLSPDHGPLKDIYPFGFCKFTPSCSEYTKQSIVKHGLIFGSTKGFWRILRCNPCSKGGVDKA